MALTTDLRAYLAAQATIAAIVGSDAQGTVRVYCGSAPQGQARPYVVIYQVGGGDQSHLSGAAGWAQPRLQVDCWADRYVTARQLADAIRDAVRNFSGTWNGRTIHECEVENDIDLSADNPLSQGDVVHRVALDLRVLCSQALPNR